MQATVCECIRRRPRVPCARLSRAWSKEMLATKYLIAIVTPLVTAVIGRISDALTDWSDSLFGSKFSSAPLQEKHYQ